MISVLVRSGLTSPAPTTASSAATPTASPHLTATASATSTSASSGPGATSLASPLLASALAPASSTSSAPASLTHVPAAIASIASIVAPLTSSLASEPTVATIITPASALSSPATSLVHPGAASIASASSSHAAPVRRVTGVRGHLLDLHLLSSNVTGALLDKLLGNALLLEGDEAEVLGRVVFALVNGPDDLTDGAELTEMLLDLVLANPRVGELTNVDLSGLDVCLLYCDTFTLQQK